MLTTKKTLFWLTYVMYIFAMIILIDYFFYLSYKSKIMTMDYPKEKLPEILHKLGFIANDKKSGFTNFKEGKEKGIIRIGCFGDSLTQGDEVNDIYDYPSLLQSIFRSNGYDNVEVINFGSGGYGFQQAFMLWEYAGKKYNLDYILLGPTCFQHERDSTFNNNFSEGYPKRNFSVMNSRYILKDNGVQLMDLVGESRFEIFLNYNRFIPPLRYILFDRQAPPFLFAPIACLLPDKELKKNPFYYQKDIAKEMNSIYKLLLTKMADDVPQIILGHNGEDIVSLGKELNKNNLFSVLLYRTFTFPYLAYGNHNSPCGNQIVAQQMFDCLTNKPESTLTIIKTENIDKELIKEKQFKKLKLSEYRNIAIEINNVKIGRFFDVGFSASIYCGDQNCEPMRNTFSGTSSLITLNSDNRTILDAVFIPLDFELRENMPLTLKIQTKSVVKNYSLGGVKLLNPNLNIGIVDIGNIIFDSSNNKIIKLTENNIMAQNVPFLNKGDTITLLLQDVPILSARIKAKGDEPEFTSIGRQFVIIRANGEEILDIGNLTTEGVVYLSLYSEYKEPIRVPWVKWIKTNIKVPLGNPRLHFLSITNS